MMAGERQHWSETEPPEGFYDDEELGLEPPKPRQTPTEGERQLMAKAAAKVTPQMGARVTRCSRCPSMAESYKKNGVTYITALCRPCSDVEWSERWQLRYNAAEERHDLAEMERLREEERRWERRGRRFVGRR